MRLSIWKTADEFIINTSMTHVYTAFSTAPSAIGVAFCLPLTMALDIDMQFLIVLPDYLMIPQRQI